jgi:NAD(P)-dependent dehydrogenase (short-subunit alcohol dehydrogenase family)
MFGRIDQVWGGIDILVNNAGTDGHRAFGWGTDIAAWRKVMGNRRNSKPDWTRF